MTYTTHKTNGCDAVRGAVAGRGARGGYYGVAVASSKLYRGERVTAPPPSGPLCAMTSRLRAGPGAICMGGVSHNANKISNERLYREKTAPPDTRHMTRQRQPSPRISARHVSVSLQRHDSRQAAVPAHDKPTVKLVKSQGGLKA